MPVLASVELYDEMVVSRRLHTGSDAATDKLRVLHQVRQALRSVPRMLLLASIIPAAVRVRTTLGSLVSRTSRKATNFSIPFLVLIT